LAFSYDLKFGIVSIPNPANVNLHHLTVSIDWQAGYPTTYFKENSARYPAASPAEKKASQ